MVWKPSKALGLIVGMIIVLTIIGVDAFLVSNMVGQSFNLSSYFTALLFVLSLPLLVLWIYWYYGLLTLRYHLDRNALSIVCGTSRYTIPMEAIRRIAPGSDFAVSRSFRGIGWPGYLIGHTTINASGVLLVHATEPIERQLVVVTDTLAYGISPGDANGFLVDYAARRALGPIREVRQAVEYVPFVASPVWRDVWYWLAVVCAFLAVVALFGFIASIYGALPDRMPLHFDARGDVDRVATKSGFLVVPGIGALTLLVNSLLGLVIYRHERLGSYLLAGMALVVQGVLWLATFSILSR